jgi:FMN-dependent NADH-azoreductase
MKKIIHITSSTNGEQSFSTQLGKAIIEKIQAQHVDALVTERDLISHPAPVLSGSHVAAFFTPEDQHTPEMVDVTAYSTSAVAELLETDMLVISAPMINFSIPSQLKSWIDHISRSGKTFRYSEAGPEGLVQGKKVFVALSAGAIYTEGPMKSLNFMESYLKGIFGFMGMTDVTVFWVEGTSMPGMKETALERAIENIVISQDSGVIA